MLERVCAVVLAGFGLIGCEQVSRVTDGLASIGAEHVDVTSEGIRTLSLLRGDVRVRGPEAYCIDQGASDARGGFAVLVGCALLTDEVALMPMLDGLITVQFGAPDTASVTGNEEAFAAFLSSAAGRGVLAASGDATQVAQVDTVQDTSGVLARFEDTSGLAFAGTAGPQWRGFMDVNGRLVTVSVLSFARDPMSRSAGERLLRLTMAELVSANALAVDVAENG